jgi:hypothetical protein
MMTVSWRGVMAVQVLNRLTVDGYEELEPHLRSVNDIIMSKIEGKVNT